MQFLFSQNAQTQLRKRPKLKNQNLKINIRYFFPPRFYFNAKLKPKNYLKKIIN